MQALCIYMLSHIASPILTRLYNVGGFGDVVVGGAATSLQGTEASMIGINLSLI